MNEISTFIHPGLFFFALAVILAFWPAQNNSWKYLLPLPGILAFIAVLGMDQGTFGHVSYLGQELILGRVDSLAVIFAHVFALQGIIGFIYAWHVQDKAQHIASAMYITGALGCVFAGDYLTLFIFWEIMSVASTFLVWLNRTKKSRAAGFRYFLFHTLGGLFLLGGLLLRYWDVGSFAFTPIDPSAAAYYDYLILLGFAVNAAVVPLHAWLPDAYPRATVTGAVFMSAFTTKTAVYVMARGFAGFEVLAVMGVIMTIYGVFYATIENNIRRILSYHIVSQVGFMVAGIGIGTAMTMNGACAHAYAHIVYKGLLFMGTGALLYAAGTAKLTELGGLVSRLPLVFIAYVIGAISISGFPLFSGFVSKTMTIEGAAQAHRYWLALGMEFAAVGTFLSVGIKLTYFAFFSKPDSTRELKPIPGNMYLGMALASLICFVLGVYPKLLYDLLPHEVTFHPYSAWKVLMTMQLMGFVGLGFYFLRFKLKPENKLNLDFDWFYRKAGSLCLALARNPVERLDNIWTTVYSRLGLRGLMGMAKGSSQFDREDIDRVVDGTAYGVMKIGRNINQTQTGYIQDYLAIAVFIGLIAAALVLFV
ncbi:MAG: Na(+)/H(+) antiporter subunit D [Desulfonatronovibrionaceae bacterium]